MSPMWDWDDLILPELSRISCFIKAKCASCYMLLYAAICYASHSCHVGSGHCVSPGKKVTWQQLQKHADMIRSWTFQPPSLFWNVSGFCPSDTKWNQISFYIIKVKPARTRNTTSDLEVRRLIISDVSLMWTGRRNSLLMPHFNAFCFFCLSRN